MSWTDIANGDSGSSIRAKLNSIGRSSVVNVLNFIPAAEHADILARTSDYDCTSAFQEAHDSLSVEGSQAGEAIYIPPGEYKLSSTWEITKRVSIVGAHGGDWHEAAATVLTVPANTDAIHFLAGSAYSQISGCHIRASAKTSTGRGIYAVSTVHIDGVMVRDFKSHGIEIHGHTGDPQIGIADFSSIKRCRIVNNDGDGVYLHGNDAQICVIEQVESIENGGWGFNDATAFGNTYVACQAAGNEAGSYRGISLTTYYGNVYLGCYVEFGDGETPEFDANAIVIGNTLAAVAPEASNFAHRFPGGFGPNVGPDGVHMWFRNNAEIARIDNDDHLLGLAGVKVSSGNSDYVHASGNVIENKTSSTASEDRVRFDNPNGRVGSITTSGSATAYNTSSDYRLKDNVQPMAGALDAVQSLRPVTWEWKAGGVGQGFIAHELQAVIPDAVTGEKDGEDMQQVDYSKVVATLTAAVQELSTRLAACEAHAR